MALALLAWWAFTFLTFWISKFIIAWPWQYFTGEHLDLRNPRRKIITSGVLTAAQAIVFWLFISVASQGAPILRDLIFLSIMINCALVIIVWKTNRLDGSQWAELEWIAGVQTGIWLLCVVAYLIL